MERTDFALGLHQIDLRLRMTSLPPEIREAAPATDLEPLLIALDEDATGIFWG